MTIPPRLRPNGALQPTAGRAIIARLVSPTPGSRPAAWTGRG